MGASAVDLDLSVQVSRVTRCTSAGPPVESRRHGARSESNCLSFLFTPYISVGMGLLYFCRFAKCFAGPGFGVGRFAFPSIGVWLRR